MLSKFFFAQWENSGTKDWTLEVRKNLIELGLPTDLDLIKKMSKNALKKLVKKHAKNYEFMRLLKIKENKLSLECHTRRCKLR